MENQGRQGPVRKTVLNLGGTLANEKDEWRVTWQFKVKQPLHSRLPTVIISILMQTQLVKGVCSTVSLFLCPLMLRMETTMMSESNFSQFQRDCNLHSV